MTEDAITHWAAGDHIGTLSRHITQEQMDIYGIVSASNGKIHVDPEWATPRFGGTVSQGMMVLGLVEELFGQHWRPARLIQSGKYDVKFVGMTRPGDTITAEARVDRVDRNGVEPTAVCSFKCTRQNGDTVIVGTARISSAERGLASS